MKYSTTMVAVAFCAALFLARGPAIAAPYDASSVITDITFDGSTHQTGAPGTDNWPVTWADDNNQYTSGGDGNGFAEVTRSSLIVSRIEGEKDSYGGTDVWASATSGNGPADGKSYGIISIAGDLYMWVSPASGSEGYRYSKLWKSTNKGQSWIEASWQFDGRDAFGADNHGFINPTFLQFGKDYQGALDSFVYIYANELTVRKGLNVQIPGSVSLMRVPKTQIMDRNSYEFYVGQGGGGSPLWSADILQRQPVFQDNAGVGWNISASHNAPLNRYFLITEHGETFKSNIGIFDGPTPWGPWTTVLYEKWSVPGTGSQTHFFWNFSNKWLSADGKQFVMVSTGVGGQDHWNSVEGNFVVDGVAGVITPNPPDSLVAQ